MRGSSYHTHTTYCDGKNTPEEMVLEAIALGCAEIGFSGHAFTVQDNEFCMSKECTKEYRNCIRQLQEKYAGQIRILMGIEQDYYSDDPEENYDYMIGSVHMVEKNGYFLPVDASRDLQIQVVESFYGGDFYGFIEDYYALVGDIYRKTHCQIIGHFDLITKFNESGDLFDTNHPRYVAAASAALHKLLPEPVIFEINSGAISRGYRTTPYPEPWILNEILNSGKPVIYTSDCHDKRFLLTGIPDDNPLLQTLMP